MEKKNIMRKNPQKVDFVRMFMAQADHDRCFYGTLKEDKDVNGNSSFFSRITINDGILMASAEDRKTLSKILNEMCIMYLDKGLHNDKGKYIPNWYGKIYIN
jgi:hypothetical protein